MLARVVAMELAEQFVGQYPAMHHVAIAMYRARGQDLTLYKAFLRTRQAVFGNCTGAEFLRGQAANPALQDLSPEDLAAIFIELAEEDLHRATW